MSMTFNFKEGFCICTCDFTLESMTYTNSTLLGNSYETSTHHFRQVDCHSAIDFFRSLDPVVDLSSPPVHKVTKLKISQCDRSLTDNVNPRTPFLAAGIMELFMKGLKIASPQDEK